MAEENKKRVNDLLQVVVFRLAGEEYAVDINQVREIIKWIDVTKIPDTPEFIDGVINLRSNIIVVVDLEVKLGLKHKAVDSHTRIVILEIAGNAVGIVVDEVSEVLKIPSSDIHEPPAAISQKLGSDYLKGVAIVGKRLLILVDFDKLLGVHSDEIKKAAKSQ